MFSYCHSATFEHLLRPPQTYKLVSSRKTAASDPFVLSDTEPSQPTTLHRRPLLATGWRSTRNELTAGAGCKQDATVTNRSAPSGHTAATHAQHGPGYIRPHLAHECVDHWHVQHVHQLIQHHLVNAHTATTKQQDGPASHPDVAKHLGEGR